MGLHESNFDTALVVPIKIFAYTNLHISKHRFILDANLSRIGNYVKIRYVLDRRG